MSHDTIDIERDIERLDQFLDGEFLAAAESSSEEVATVDAICGSNDQLVAELAQLRLAFEALDAEHVAVRPDFTDNVMAALPRRRSWLAWVAAAILAAGLALGSTALLRGIDGLGVVATIGDFVATSVLVGFGFLGASWTSLQGVISSWLVLSPVTATVLVAITVAAGLVVVRRLRRRPAAVERRRVQ